METKLSDPKGTIECRIIRDEVPMTLSKSWTTFMPVLSKILSITSGDVLELGTGIMSTPYLHWMCYPTKRKLVSYENSSFYADIASQYIDDFHDVYITGSYREINVEKEWDVVFIDFFEVQDRHIPLERLLKHAKYIVMHDSTYLDFMGVSKFRFDYSKEHPCTSVFSDLIDVSNLEI